MNTETAIWKDLKRKTDKDVHWTRVEARVGAGIPDINGAYLWPVRGQRRAIEIWCELKVCKTKSYKTAGLWRPAQIAWQTARSKYTDTVWNLVSHPQAEVIKIYSGAKLPLLWDDTSGKVEPDLVIRYRNPFDSWSVFLNLAAERAFDPSHIIIGPHGP